MTVAIPALEATAFSTTFEADEAASGEAAFAVKFTALFLNHSETGDAERRSEDP